MQADSDSSAASDRRITTGAAVADLSPSARQPVLGPCWTCARSSSFTVTKGPVVRTTCGHHLAGCVRMLAERLPSILNCNVYAGGIRLSSSDVLSEARHG